jgi:MFS family permease
VDRRKILILSNLAAFGSVLLLFAVRSAATAPLALVAVGAIAVSKAFYSPAASAALPNVVDPPDLAAANTVAGSAWGTMTVVGASLGGVVSSVFSPYACFAVTAVCLLTGTVLTGLIRRPLQAPRGGAEAGQSLRAMFEALRYIAARPRVRALVTVKSAVGLGNGVLTVFPLIAAAHGAGAIGAGLLFALRGAGALVGPLVMRPVLNRPSWLLPGLALSMGLYGVGYLGVAFAPWFPLVLALVFVAHFAGGTNWVLSNFALQAEVPDELRGRIFAVDMMLATLAIAISQLGAGLFVDRVDQRIILATCALITLCYAIGWRIATRRLAPVTRTADPADRFDIRD